MTFKHTIAAGLIALSALAVAGPAGATSVIVQIGQSYEGGYNWHQRHRHPDYGTLTPREVRAVLRDEGYREVRYLDRRGKIYEVRATNRRGHRVGLVVSARSGRILNAYRL